MKKEKGEQYLLPKILLIALVAFFLNIINFIYKMNKLSPQLTGYSIVSRVGEMYSSLPVTSKAILLIQWGVLILLLIYAAFRDKGLAEDKKELKSLNLNQISGASGTDLDVLYKLLKEKGKLRISTIAKAFKIDKDLAMEWAKTMEEGKLAVVDYPRFSGPVLKIEGKITIKKQEKIKK